jgi:hypothetical protein
VAFELGAAVGCGVVVFAADLAEVGVGGVVGVLVVVAGSVGVAAITYGDGDLNGSGDVAGAGGVGEMSTPLWMMTS